MEMKQWLRTIELTEIQQVVASRDLPLVSCMIASWLAQKSRHSRTGPRSVRLKMNVNQWQDKSKVS